MRDRLARPAVRPGRVAPVAGVPVPRPAPGGPPADRPRLDSLTSLRFFAALLVVVAHVGGMSTSPVVRAVTHHGDVGVDFFYILSGFVLTWSASADGGARRFYRRRFARIYPLHATTWLIAVVAGLTGLLGVGGHRAEALNLVLLQSWVPNLGIVFSANIPAWSLSDEAFFYLLFPIVVVLVGRGTAAARWTMLAVTALLVIVAVPVLGGGEYWIFVFPPTRILEFIAGVLLAHLLRDGWTCPVGIVPAALLAACAIAATALVNGPFGVVAIAAAPLWLLIAATATRNLRGAGGVLQQPWLIRLGVWSFALYLVHNLIIGVVLRFTGLLPAPELLAAGVAIPVASIGLAGLAYRVVERPAEARLRGPGRAAISMSA